MNEFNIAPNTQIGKIVVPDKIYDNENVYGNDPDKYSRSGEFIENIVTDNFIEGCHRWFKLANFQEILEDIDEYFNPLGYGKYSELIDNEINGYYSPIIPTVSKVKSPIRITNQKLYKPIVFNYERNKEINYKTLKEKEENEH